METVLPTDPEPAQSQAVQGTAEKLVDAPLSADAAAKYDAVMAFCLQRGQVLFTTLMTEFVQVQIGDLERYQCCHDVHSAAVASCWTNGLCLGDTAASCIAAPKA